MENGRTPQDPHALEPTRLERLLFRLEAQHICLNWAVEQIRNRPGPVFELGLGHGRTFDHLRRHLPDRDIFVFDREIDCFADCTPDETHLILGKLSDTLPQARHRFAGQVVLVNSDVGTYDEAYNAEVAALVSQNLPALLAPGAIVLSDLPLNLPEAWRLPLPAAVRSERYYMYRSSCEHDRSFSQSA
ncbi:class I SAM-dependent methyltransferase [Taklimakanibacter lacteus]|uniref:class I SAM-dependent methyltransferase n=1 Tax=Taklimakanibacter lacteus TaxID=2268456 RepID=UPI000E66F1EA